MRVLIVGAGIAGLTLAAKLRQQRRDTAVVERASSYSDAGYGISLWPLGNCVLHGLGVFDEFMRRGVESGRYEMVDHSGEVLQTLELSVFTENSGPMVMLVRTDLIDVLRKACGELPIRFGTTVEKAEQVQDEVNVTFSDGTSADVDLVVGCDGIHSKIRPQICPEPEVFDARWVLWTWWGREGHVPSDVIRDYWGRGYFFGAYPVPGRCMFIVGLPANTLTEQDRSLEAILPKIKQTLNELTEIREEVDRALSDAQQLFAWPMADVRGKKWYSGRIALCGGASTAFLPTAGVGASNAMRSAAALADELSKADAAHVSRALQMYEKRCRTIVEKNQSDSRNTARLVFLKSKALGWGRDQLIKHYPAKRMVKQIVKSMSQPF